MKSSLWITGACTWICLVAATSFGQPGSFREVSVKNKDVIAIANFAIETQGKKQKVELVKLLKAESQVVAGRNYKLQMEVRVEGGVRTANATVWAKLDGSNELSKWEWVGDVRPEGKAPKVEPKGEPKGEPKSEPKSGAPGASLEIAKEAPKGEPKPFPGKESKWNGFVQHNFQVDGANVLVVEPAKALPGRPWAWRGEFFGAFPNADVELVKAGWHLAYISVPNLFGSPKAMVRWEKFHAALVNEYGLHSKPALIGLSRGALYCMAWAAAHPEKTMAVYLDNGVCDFKSWPGGKIKELGTGAGSAGEWQNVLKAFDFKNDQEAIAYKGNPVDNLATMAKAKIPLLLVYGDSDKVVPHKENSEIVFNKYKALEAPVERIVKPGQDHHPHGLTDPKPIVEFLEKARLATK